MSDLKKPEFDFSVNLFVGKKRLTFGKSLVSGVIVNSIHGLTIKKGSGGTTVRLDVKAVPENIVHAFTQVPGKDVGQTGPGTPGAVVALAPDKDVVFTRTVQVSEKLTTPVRDNNIFLWEFYSCRGKLRGRAWNLQLHKFMGKLVVSIFLNYDVAICRNENGDVCIPELDKWTTLETFVRGILPAYAVLHDPACARANIRPPAPGYCTVLWWNPIGVGRAITFNFEQVHLHHRKFADGLQFLYRGQQVICELKEQKKNGHHSMWEAVKISPVKKRR